ncbi:MAG: hypothetical protein JWM32_141 [Verrucomicrobia bacterium]|nr:hypothetical protein [Verrucomicrobiota bacterium]
MSISKQRACAGWRLPIAVMAVVVLADLGLVALAGTDIPFMDQWNVEGQWLYPAWSEGSLRARDLFQPFNEHRLVWTHLLNLGLFKLNGQWDPLVQVGVIAVLRGACAAGATWIFLHGWAGKARIAFAAIVAMAFLPHLAWQVALWGFESQVGFALGFSLLALVLLTSAKRTLRQTVLGLVAGLSALLAMGVGALVPVALLGLAILRGSEQRRFDRNWWTGIGPSILLLVMAWALHASAKGVAVLAATNLESFLSAAGRMLSWPMPSVAAVIPMNLPLALVVLGRALRRRKPVEGEDYVVVVGVWAVALAFATAWARGAGAEISGGVPSRYVDFIVLLPLANAWCVATLAREAAGRWRGLGRMAAVAWGLVLLVGWLGLSAEVQRRLVLPRIRDRNAPERLMAQWQQSRDPSVFAGQPRLYVPAENLAIVAAVVDDPRMRGRLPPSLQPAREQGFLSRMMRVGRDRRRP